MTGPSYSCLVANTVTGAILDELPISDFSWTDSLDLSRPGQMTVTVPLLNDDHRRETSQRVKARSVASGPWLLSLVLVRNGRPLWAGPLVTHSSGDTAVTFGCASITKVLDARLVITDGYELDPANPAADVKSSLSQAGVAAQLLQLAVAGFGCALPLTIPAVSTLGDTDRVYAAADVASVLARLTQLSQETSGPDVRFTPRLNQNQTSLSWTVDIGQPRLGDASAPWVWDYPASILSVSEDSDASGMTFRGYVPGDSGQGGIRPFGVSQDTTRVNAGFPMLERVSRDTASVREKVLLDRQSTSYVAANTTPAVAWKVTVDPEMWPEIGTWNFGDNARFSITGHHWVEDGDVTHRVIGVTHTPNQAALETSPALGAI